MLNNASRKFFLCDSTKFDTRAPFRQCALSGLNGMVCEGNEGERFRDTAKGILIL